MSKIAVLLTCFNRKEQTLKCLKSVYDQKLNTGIVFTIYLVDDGSTDGTAEIVGQAFPEVHLIQGNGMLFWAGGMRKAWNSAINDNDDLDYFFLLNDDTILAETAIADLLADIEALGKTETIMIGTTVDPATKSFSYGGRLLLNNYSSKSKKVIPDGQKPQLCHLGNANMMLVPNGVVQRIGILSGLYTHGMADYDYTLKARRNGIKSYIGSQIGGYCQDDHGNNWVKPGNSVKQRIKYLYSVKGLAYKEYLNFIKLYFPLYLPHAWILLWAKTLLPSIWEKYKN
jgi:GT2 family glycosyltransferase